jgi:hypothetical protein
VGAVLELDVHPGPELFEVEPAPVDSDRVADGVRFLGRGSRWSDWTSDRKPNRAMVVNRDSGDLDLLGAV